MISLGIESTAHTFGISLVDFEKKKILTNEKVVFSPPEGKGMLPRECADFHAKNAPELLRGINFDNVDIISYSQGPGIGQMLSVGSFLARYLSLKYNKPLVGVNHCTAHLEISNMLNNTKNPVMLYVSGGNTQVIAFHNKKYRIFGETLDIALGNLFDTFGRKAGINFPSGQEIEKLAKKGKYIELPYTVKGMDVSFSGILTSAVNKLKQGAKLEDICYSLQETCFSMMVEVSERAMSHCRINELIVAGGVAANKRLQEMCKVMCKERNAEFYSIPIEYAGDNPAMIAWLGALEYNSGVKTKVSEPSNQNWRTDQVEVIWK